MAGPAAPLDSLKAYRSSSPIPRWQKPLSCRLAFSPGWKPCSQATQQPECLCLLTLLPSLPGSPGWPGTPANPCSNDMRHIEWGCYIRVHLATTTGRLWLASVAKKREKLWTDVFATCSRQICNQRRHSVSRVSKKKRERKHEEKGVRMSSCSYKLFPNSETLEPFDCGQGNLQPTLISAQSNELQPWWCFEVPGKWRANACLFFFKCLLNLLALFAFWTTNKGKKTYAGDVVWKVVMN